MRYRFHQISLATANLFVVPALLASAFEMAVIHGQGSTITAVGHTLMGLTAVGMAAGRVYEAREPTSATRHAAAGSCMTLMALILLFFQP
jgi:hypothetical protein